MITAVDRQLVQFEAKRSLKQPLLWVGTLVSILFVTWGGFAQPDRWPGEQYTRIVDHSAIPLAVAAFIIGALAMIRDAREPFAPAAAVDVERRTPSRVAVLVPPVLVAVGLSIAIAVIARSRGGFLLGEAPGNTNNIQPPVAALLQGPLMVAAVGALGMLIGRLTKSVVASTIIAAAFTIVFLLASWAWRWLPAAPLQYTPFDVDLPNFDPANPPEGWYLSAPNEYDKYWRRMLIHVPTIIGHNVYLVGATMVCGGVAVGRTRAARRAALAGGAIAVAGIVSQLVTFPS